MTAAPRVLVVGDVMQDIVVRPEGPLRRGTDTPAAIRAVPGGSAANQAAWLAAEVLAVTLCGRVGAADHDGLVASFAEAGVEARLTADTDRPTGRLISLIDPDGERSFLTDRGANLALGEADVPDAALADVICVVLSGYSFFDPATRKAARDVLRRARARDLMVALDPASAGFITDVGAKEFLSWIEGVTVLLPNDEEAQLLAGASDPETQLDELCARFPVVAITRGPDGAVVREQEGPTFSAAPSETRVLDTTGAGDAFAAGFLAAWLTGASPEAALEAGVATAGQAVAHVGGRPEHQTSDRTFEER